MIFRWLAVLLAVAPLSQAQEKSPVQLDLGGGQTLQLIRIEPGTFRQGSPSTEAGRGADETLRQVTLTKPFLLGKFPVTRGQFARFVAEAHYRTDAESGPSGGFGWDGKKLTQRRDFTWRNPGFFQTDDHPVVLVTYHDASVFLQWLSRKTGRTFALPSEAQWEYAARAGSDKTSKAENGSWHLGNAGNATHSVGEMPLNGWGLGDMNGNVWEWCEDWYAPYSSDSITDPLQSDATLSDKPRRVLRGGSWLREKKFCRPAARYRNDPLSRNADNGFRVMTFQVEAHAVAPPVTNATSPKFATPIQSLTFNNSAPGSAPMPRAIATSSTSYAAESRGSFNFGWPVILPFFAVAVIIIGFIVRTITRAIFSNMGGSGGFFSMPGLPVRVRIADDGFWILADNVVVGTPITCNYDAGNGTQQLEVRYEPSPQGQFVFTGTRPSKVTVSVNRGGSPFRSMGTRSRISDDTIDNPSFCGHPPAY
ncbi:MAG TPA: SUMF1/EgtB/PvdO family nonheme iron enzyme [Chthoniobacter sp.]|jgi:formylglycine-generating enzyme required for sulfatase activity